jgi:hypothetical protein
LPTLDTTRTIRRSSQWSRPNGSSSVKIEHRQTMEPGSIVGHYRTQKTERKSFY